MDVIEAMETCSAARYLRPDLVPQDLIERVIYAATRASSPGNSQEWDVIVVRNSEAKRKIRDLLAPRFKAMGVGVSTTGRVTSRMIAGAMHGPNCTIVSIFPIPSASPAINAALRLCTQDSGKIDGRSGTITPYDWATFRIASEGESPSSSFGSKLR
jgi:nitroreductase